MHGKRRQGCATVAGLALALALSVHSAVAQECAFVSIPEQGRVAIINPLEGVAVASVPIENPGDLLLHPRGDRLFVTVTDGLAVVDLESRQITRSEGIPRPRSLTLSGDGETLYAAAGLLLYRLSPDDLTLRDVYTLPPEFGTWGIAASADGTLVYGVGFGNGIRTFRVATGEVKQLSNTTRHTSIVLNDYGTRAFVSERFNGGVYTIDTMTGAVLRVSGGRGRLHRQAGDSVFVYDELTGAFSAPVPFSVNGDAAVTPGGLVVGTNFYGVAVYELATGYPRAQIELGDVTAEWRITAGYAPGVCSGTGCAGDCNADAVVTVDELVSGLGIALGQLPLEDCLAIDVYADQRVDVAEVVGATDAALHSCIEPARQRVNIVPPIRLRSLGGDLQVADLNNDGWPDVTGAERSFLNQGDAHFDAGHRSVAGLVVPDLNGDLLPDKVVLNKTESTIRILFGNGDGTFREELLETWSLVAFPGYRGGPVTIFTGDFNGDGFTDVGAWMTLGFAVSLLGSGDGHFTRVDALTLPQSSFGAGHPFIVADLNDDGKLDVLEVYVATLWLGRGDGTFEHGTRAGIPIPLLSNDDRLQSVVDINGDRFPDLMWMSHILLGGPGPRFVEASVIPRLGEVASGDFDADGAADLIGTYIGFVAILRGRGDGDFYPPHFIDVGTPIAVRAISDFNLDGRDDIAAEAGDDLVVLLSEG